MRTIDDINELDISSFELKSDDLWFLDTHITPPQVRKEIGCDSKLLEEAGLVFPSPEQAAPPSKPAVKESATDLHLHVICVDCGFDVVVASLDIEGSRYTQCMVCGRKTFVVHNAAMCLIAKKYCPIWREAKGLPQMNLKFWIQHMKRLGTNEQKTLEVKDF